MHVLQSGSDDKPGGGTQVLIAIVGHPDNAVIYGWVPVVAHVLDPLKVLGTRHLRK